MAKELMISDFDVYLAANEQKSQLRFLTCGSVDDGKSSLIGRLLHDSKLIYDDQLAALQRDSRKFNTTDQEVDLALLVDGLQAEREQGITIDVAYRYFSTDKRKFIIADTPGHEQYTRNMATGASHCDLAIILIDARSGVKPQTRRHSFICSLLGIKHIVVAINKMDLVNYEQQCFDKICHDFMAFTKDLHFVEPQFIPLSALRGDNVVERSVVMPWYQDETLLTFLESVEVNPPVNGALRFPVQYVNRPDGEFRGYCGTVARGVVRVGDLVRVWPSGKESKVERIVTFDGDLPSAETGQAITLTLNDDIDISRGDVIVSNDEKWENVSHVSGMLVWLHEQPLQPHQQYEIRIGTRVLTGSVESIDYRVDVNDFSHHAAAHLRLNEIAHCKIKFTQSIPVDLYQESHKTGSFIIVDRISNATLGAGMISEIPSAEFWQDSKFSEFELELNALIRKHFPHWDAKNIRELL
ncbi:MULTISPECIES: sulfate adenylyltransferase subunit CysN [Aeromonas]|uniref:Sulfate adenylyltransferase subunit 1 n=1 Tax=Aeromonas caviae TaxID=648 RepID=A0AAV4YIU2_AERCA|nr:MULTISPECIES: sulfate adenylyltransferase subunit CysN [Aeromonas]TNI17148.1 sulfate adenylyltransferase subunit CysN [Aeromonas dhakensis]TNI53876.1 sulfate adenylyltransferase subunit CysN [Aeromonas dhakensis]GJA32500.1 sulfate adenylyltransferase subunit 1 [Aeromonas caviae]GJA36912.1 sulfate adenylyltransferase subunit 1 [Aeromonas caviae]GJA40694.1 sulfate adenylyltransferase subunit 1 [Aeromonas caviae]